MADEIEVSENTEAAAAATEGDSVENGETQKTMPPLTAERVTDIAFGLGKLAFDALDQAARELDDRVRQIRTDTPGFIAEVEEKGKPIREQVAQKFKSVTPGTLTDLFTRTTGGGGTPPEPNGSAVDEITALENRVRELEQQVGGDEPVATPTATAEPSPFSMLELEESQPAVVVPVDDEITALEDRVRALELGATPEPVVVAETDDTTTEPTKKPRTRKKAAEES